MATDSRKRSGREKLTRTPTSVGGGSVAGGLLVLATNPDYEAICTEAVRKLPRRLRSVVARQSAKSTASFSPRLTLVVSGITDISRTSVQRSGRSATTRLVVFVNGVPVEAIADRLLSLQIRSSHRLHIASKPDRVAEGELIYRLVSSMAEVDGSQSIVDAWVEGEDLVLLSPAFERMIVPGDKLSRFLASDLSKLSSFEIDEDGRYLYWPHSDTHLGWKQLHQILEPTATLDDVKKLDNFSARYGNAVRTLRELSGIKQSEIAGLTSRQLRRIEHGEQVVSKNALQVLSRAHGVPLDAYLRKLAKLASVNAK